MSTPTPNPKATTVQMVDIVAWEPKSGSELRRKSVTFDEATALLHSYILSRHQANVAGPRGRRNNNNGVYVEIAPVGQATPQQFRKSLQAPAQDDLNAIFAGSSDDD